jgi:hypothetical protein
MRTARLVMVVAAACFAASSLTAAQGRGNGPAGRGPQIARGGSGGPNVGIGHTGGGHGGSAGVTPGGSAKGRGNPGTTPGKGGNAGGVGGGNAGEERGKGGAAPGNAREGHGNAGGGGRGNADGDRGNAGKPPAENPGGRGNAGGGGRGNADDDHDAPGGGRGRGGSNREPGASFVAQMNPQLRTRLEAMLPSGVTLEQAAEGFRNQGQFIAALQQSQNHDISFGDLKAQMTGDNPLSLGEAMRKLGVETDED